MPTLKQQTVPPKPGNTYANIMAQKAPAHLSLEKEEEKHYDGPTGIYDPIGRPALQATQIGEQSSSKMAITPINETTNPFYDSSLFQTANSYQISESNKRRSIHISPNASPTPRVPSTNILHMYTNPNLSNTDNANLPPQ